MEKLTIPISKEVKEKAKALIDPNFDETDCIGMLTNIDIDQRASRCLYIAGVSEESVKKIHGMESRQMVRRLMSISEMRELTGEAPKETCYDKYNHTPAFLSDKCKLALQYKPKQDESGEPSGLKLNFLWDWNVWKNRHEFLDKFHEFAQSAYYNKQGGHHDILNRIK